MLVAEGDVVRVERYWRWSRGADERRDEEWLERVRETVGAAVRRRLVADVPLGALLSGGIDSSVVVAAMAQASSEPVRTFTVGFARRRATTSAPTRGPSPSGTARSTRRSWSSRTSTELLPRLARAFDEPLGDEAALPQFVVSELARRHVTVALAGDGGDEAFAGYERYAAVALAGRVRAAGCARRPRRAPALRQARGEPRSPRYRAAPAFSRWRRCRGRRATGG